MSKKKEVLRWVCVPFAAIITHFLVYALVNFAFSINTHSPYSTGTITNLGMMIYTFGIGFITGGATVIVPSFVAPKHQKTTSTVITSSFLTLLVISGILLYSQGDSYNFWEILETAGMFIGAISGCGYLHNEVKEEELP